MKLMVICFLLIILHIKFTLSSIKTCFYSSYDNETKSCLELIKQDSIVNVYDNTNKLICNNDSSCLEKNKDIGLRVEITEINMKEQIKLGNGILNSINDFGYFILFDYKSISKVNCLEYDMIEKTKINTDNPDWSSFFPDKGVDLISNCPRLIKRFKMSETKNKRCDLICDYCFTLDIWIKRGMILMSYYNLNDNGFGSLMNDDNLNVIKIAELKASLGRIRNMKDDGLTGVVMILPIKDNLNNDLITWLSKFEDQKVSCSNDENENKRVILHNNEDGNGINRNMCDQIIKPNYDNHGQFMIFVDNEVNRIGLGHLSNFDIRDVILTLRSTQNVLNSNKFYAMFYIPNSECCKIVLFRNTEFFKTRFTNDGLEVIIADDLESCQNAKFKHQEGISFGLVKFNQHEIKLDTNFKFKRINYINISNGSKHLFEGYQGFNEEIRRYIRVILLEL